jgi:hypothetical protein
VNNDPDASDQAYERQLNRLHAELLSLGRSRRSDSRSTERFVTAWADGAVSPSLRSTCLGGGGIRLLQHSVTEASATDGHQSYGRKHSRDDKSGVGQTQPPASCSVTRPGPDSTPPSSIDASLEPVPWANDRSGNWFGNASVRTRLPKTGVVPAFRNQDRLSTKFPWWRLQPGNLTVTGRLKTAQGTFTAGFPASGYGSTGFIPSELTFSSEGCWEVRASNEKSQPLVFVIWVQESP